MRCRYGKTRVEGALINLAQHGAYHYSVTVHTDDFGVLACLRGLSFHAQATGNRNIPWGGTSEKEWNSSDHRATFRFTSVVYRSNFISEAERLLSGRWIQVDVNDFDPARPRRMRRTKPKVGSAHPYAKGKGIKGIGL